MGKGCGNNFHLSGLDTEYGPQKPKQKVPETNYQRLLRNKLSQLQLEIKKMKREVESSTVNMKRRVQLNLAKIKITDLLDQYLKITSATKSHPNTDLIVLKENEIVELFKSKRDILSTDIVSITNLIGTTSRSLDQYIALTDILKKYTMI